MGETLPHPDLQAFTEQAMREYLERHPDDEYARVSCDQDVKRLAKSLEWLQEMGMQGKRVLELGGPSVSSYVLQRFFPNTRIEYGRYNWFQKPGLEGWFRKPGFELRGRFPFPAESFDVVLCMEVIEHVSDIRYIHATSLSGVRNCLEESFRVLRTGGKMFLTTPNAGSLWVIHRAMLHQPPWLYEWHFREFTIDEITCLLEHAGLHVVKLRTETVWSENDLQALEDFMRKSGHSLDNRGDDIFLIAEKRRDLPVPARTLNLPI